MHSFILLMAQGLQQDYATNHELSLQIRMIPVMAFVSVVDLPATFEVLPYDSPDEIQPIVDHFEDVFIGQARRCGR